MADVNNNYQPQASQTPVQPVQNNSPPSREAPIAEVVQKKSKLPIILLIIFIIIFIVGIISVAAYYLLLSPSAPIIENSPSSSSQSSNDIGNTVGDERSSQESQSIPSPPSLPE